MSSANMSYLRYWCFKILPLVYDDSLSYYEVLCKITDYINDLIDQDKTFASEITALQTAVETLQKWIDNFDTSEIQEIVDEYLATMIWVNINDDGYIVYNIPDGWDEITFNTTGYDIDVDTEPEYGHLVLSMWVDKVRGTD